MSSHLHRRMTVRKHQSKVYNGRLSFSKSGVNINMADICLRVGHLAKTGPEGPVLDSANNISIVYY